MMANFSPLTIILPFAIPSSCQLVVVLVGRQDEVANNACAPVTSAHPASIPSDNSSRCAQEDPDGPPCWMDLDQGWEENLQLGQAFTAQSKGYSNFVDFLISQPILANELNRGVEDQVRFWTGLPY